MTKVFAVVSSVLASIMAATLFFVTVPKLQNDIDNIKIEAGGTSVTANPTGSATETLTKIDVDGTIYQFEKNYNHQIEIFKSGDFTIELNITNDSSNFMTYQYIYNYAAADVTKELTCNGFFYDSNAYITVYKVIFNENEITLVGFKSSSSTYDKKQKTYAKSDVSVSDKLRSI